MFLKVFTLVFLSIGAINAVPETKAPSLTLLELIFQGIGVSMQNFVQNSIATAIDIDSLVTNVNAQFNTCLLEIQNNTLLLDGRNLKVLMGNGVLALVQNNIPILFAQNPFLQPLLAGLVDEILNGQLQQINTIAAQSGVPVSVVNTYLASGPAPSLGTMQDDLIMGALLAKTVNDVSLYVLEHVQNGLALLIVPPNPLNFFEAVLAAFTNSVLQSAINSIAELQTSLNNGQPYAI